MEITKKLVYEDYATWMDNEKLKELIRDFARREKDSKFEFFKVEIENK